MVQELEKRSMWNFRDTKHNSGMKCQTHVFLSPKYKARRQLTLHLKVQNAHGIADMYRILPTTRDGQSGAERDPFDSCTILGRTITITTGCRLGKIRT